jgi:hypothetical protein
MRTLLDSFNESDTNIFAPDKVNHWLVIMKAIQSAFEASPDVSAEHVAIPSILSKASGAINLWTQGKTPTEVNMFSMKVNGHRYLRKIGAGDTLADFSLMGSELLEKINEDLRSSGKSDKVMVTHISKIAHNVEVANGDILSLNKYVLMQIEIYVEDESDPAFEYKVEVDKPVVVWVTEGSMNDILIGAGQLQLLGIRLDDILRRHASAVRVRRENFTPRPPQKERVVVKSNFQTKLQASQANIIKSLQIPVVPSSVLNNNSVERHVTFDKAEPTSNYTPKQACNFESSSDEEDFT